MSDSFYRMMYTICDPVFWLCSQPTVLHAGRAKRPGAYLLAAPHLSPFDVPLLMRHTPRPLDFVSIIELFRFRFIAWLYGGMNAFPLDRSQPDAAAVRIILDRLQRGRVVAMFPEGGIRKWENSVLQGGRMRAGTGRIAQLAQVPVIPAVILGASQFARFTAWLPLRRVRYGVIYGEPIFLDPALEKTTAMRVAEEQLRAAFCGLHEELTTAMRPHT